MLLTKQNHLQVSLQLWVFQCQLQALTQKTLAESRKFLGIVWEHLCQATWAYGSVPPCWILSLARWMAPKSHGVENDTHWLPETFVSAGVSYCDVFSSHKHSMSPWFSCHFTFPVHWHDIWDSPQEWGEWEPAFVMKML